MLLLKLSFSLIHHIKKNTKSEYLRLDRLFIPNAFSFNNNFKIILKKDWYFVILSEILDERKEF